MPLNRDDAEDAAWMLVALGRAPHPATWVDGLVEQARNQRAQSLPHNMI